MEILISKDLLFGIGLLLFHALVPSPCLASISVEGREAEGAKECSNDLPEFKMSVDAFMEVASSANHKRYSTCPISITLSGEITTRAISQLIETVDLTEGPLAAPLVLLNLNSNGGDVWAALEFAKHLRAKNYRFVVANVAEDNSCASACVLILAGAFKRELQGRVGIHRPYFSGERAQEAGYSSVKEAYEALYANLRDFFSAVNLSNRLIDDMWQVPSHSVKYLSADELLQSGLGRDDAILVEMENADLRSECGQSSPTAKADWLTNVFSACINPTGELNRSCFDRKTRRHPFCKCFAKLNPNWGVVCAE